MTKIGVDANWRKVPINHEDDDSLDQQYSKHLVFYLVIFSKWREGIAKYKKNKLDWNFKSKFKISTIVFCN
jgi:hypothetical protein